MLPELWDHQKKAIQIANEKVGNEYKHANYALFMEAGTGKSRTIIEILNERYNHHGKVLRTLIFAPLVVCENFRREFAQFSDISNDLIGVYNMNGPKRKNMIAEDLKKGHKKIFIINYEAVLSPDVVNLLHEFQPEIAVCDESHRLKSHNAKRSIAIEKLVRGCRYKFLLTGTPALKNPMDLFQQFKILDNGDTFGQNFWAFRGHYFEDKNARWAGKPQYFPNFQPRDKAMDQLGERVSAKSFSALKKDCLDLPPLVYLPVFVELSREQKRLYEDMKKDLITFISNKKDQPKAVMANQAMTKLLRMQQIVSGFVNTTEGEIIEVKDNPRMAALEDLLEDIVDHEKVIIWSCFTYNYKMIEKLLKKMKVKYVLVTGEQNKTEKQEAIDAFQTDGTVRVMIANQRAGGIGVNLTQASFSIYYSKGFALEDDVQSEARNYRGGSEIHDKITRIDLVAANTIDDLINQSLKDKKELLYDVLDWSTI